MSKSKERFSKREKERKRQKLKQEKQEKRQLRKENNNKGKKLEDMMAYVNSEGNLTSQPPEDQSKPTDRSSNE